jgi:hypothetical protein
MLLYVIIFFFLFNFNVILMNLKYFSAYVAISVDI